MSMADRNYFSGVLMLVLKMVTDLIALGGPATAEDIAVTCASGR